jgi:hypothetical protein
MEINYWQIIETLDKVIGIELQVWKKIIKKFKRVKNFSKKLARFFIVNLSTLRATKPV